MVSTSSERQLKDYEYADVVIRNGKVITVDSADSICEAVAVVKDTIIAVGTTDGISTYIGPETRVIDLNGQTMTPGFIDSHLHLMLYGEQSIIYVNLQPPVTSIAQIKDKIKEEVSITPPGEWVSGYGYIMGLAEGRLPDKTDLDPISENNPVFLTSADGHYGSCNQEALDIAGIDANFPDLETGGVIVRDKNGNPTGLFYNHTAMNLVRKEIPAYPIEQYRASLLYAVPFHLAAGITSFHEAIVHGLDRYQVFQDLDSRMNMRGCLYYLSENLLEAEYNIRNVTPFQGEMITFSGWKLQTDGTYLTAYTYEPHNGVTHTMANWEYSNLKKAIIDLHNTGYQIKTHVVGDKAIDMTINALQAAMETYPRKDPRHRLEHFILPTEDAVNRVQQLDLIVSVQPAFIYTGGEDVVELYGSKRAESMKPMRTLLDKGVTVCIGTDSPCSRTFMPQYTLYTAVTRKTRNGFVLNEDECVTINEALRCYTYNAAYAAFQENLKGSIEVGKLADFTVWSHDLYTIPPETLLEMEVEMTIVGGEVFFRKKGTAIKESRGS